MHVGGIFSDLAKVFDSVNHDILLSKLSVYGRKVKLSNGLYHILIAENKELKLNLLIQILNSFSNWGIVKHGVAQGSMLGPLLFLLYTMIYPK
jgi:hypothetical protein